MVFHAPVFRTLGRNLEIQTAAIGHFVGFVRVFIILCQGLQIDMIIKSTGEVDRQLRQCQIPVLYRVGPAL